MPAAKFTAGIHFRTYPNSPIIWGRKSEICGMYVMMIRTTIIVPIHGQMVLASVSNLTREISLAMKRFAPSGGVMKPIARFRIIIVPK